MPTVNGVHPNEKKRRVPELRKKERNPFHLRTDKHQMRLYKSCIAKFREIENGKLIKCMFYMKISSSPHPYSVHIHTTMADTAFNSCQTMPYIYAGNVILPELNARVRYAMWFFYSITFCSSVALRLPTQFLPFKHTDCISFSRLFTNFPAMCILVIAPSQ